MRSRWCACPQKQRNKSAPSIGHGNNWSKHASAWKPQGRSLMVNHGMQPLSNWWKARTFAQLQVPEWMKELLSNSQPILLALEEKIRALSVQLEAAAAPNQLRGMGKLTSVL